MNASGSPLKGEIVAALRKYLPVVLLPGLLFCFRDALRPFFAAFAAAYLLDIPARRLELLYAALPFTRLRRASAVVSALIAALTLLFLFGALLAPRIAESAAALYSRMPEYRASLLDFLRSLPLSPALLRLAEERETALLEQLAASGAELLSRVWRVTRTAGSALFSRTADLLTAAVCCLYMLFYKHSVLPQSRALLARLFPEAFFHLLCRLGKEAHGIFSRYIAGRAVESLLLMLLSLPGLLLARIPYAPLLALFTGAANLVPILGPLAAALTCLLLLLVIDPVKALWFLLFVLVLQQIDNQILAPHIVGGSVGLPAFWSLLAVLLGARLGGAAGAFLAVPAAAVCRSLLSHQGKIPG